MSAFDKLKPLSPKARASLRANGWMTVWEGSVRSGKTVASLIAWMSYVMNSPEPEFLMSGNTFTSLINNTITNEFGLINLFEPHVVLKSDQAGAKCLFVGDKKIYLVGANDESAYKRIKGRTVGGWYADEVATQPESFIVEAMSRTVASTDRRMFWTLNPCVPSHYIYKNFTDTWEGQPGYIRFHFTLDDNLALTEERKKELANQFVGRFKLMNIYGLRVAAEGVIYDSFDTEAIYHDTRELPNQPKFYVHQKFIACDYGTTNPCVFLEIQMSDQGEVFVKREYRWDSKKQMQQKTDEQYVEDMHKFVGNPDTCEHTIIVDPSAASFIAALKLDGYIVIPANNEVLDGIKRVSSLFSQRRLKIHASCKGLISELERYVWDEKASLNGLEKPVKQYDHAPDALRYYANTVLNTFDIFRDIVR